MIYCYSLDHSKPHLVKNPNCQNGKLDAAEVEEVVVSDMLKLSKEYEVIEEKSEQQNQKGFEAMNQRKSVLEGKLKSCIIYMHPIPIIVSCWRRLVRSIKNWKI